MKHYKLKEEVKKYLNADYEYYESVLGNQEWYHLEWTHEALEEVKEGIEVEFQNIANMHGAVFIRGRDISEQERADIEWFLNTFGSKKLVFDVVASYEYRCSMNRLQDKKIASFKEWTERGE